MLHLLGGPARCGKTTLASRAAGVRGLGWLSTDVVRGVVNLHMPLMRSEGFDVSHSAEADRFFPSFERLIESSNFLADVYVIEGVGFYPRHVERLGAHIERRAVFVGQSRVDLAALVEHAGPNAWHRELDEGSLAKLPAWIEQWSAEMEDECRSFGYPYVDLSAGDFADRLDEVERLLF